MSVDVTTESEPPFLVRGGFKLNRNVVRKEFSGDPAGISEAQMNAPHHSPAFSGSVSRIRRVVFRSSVVCPRVVI